MSASQRKSRQCAIKVPGKGEPYQRGMKHASQLAARGHLSQVNRLIHQEKQKLQRWGRNPPPHKVSQAKEAQQRLFAYLTVRYNYDHNNTLRTAQPFSLFVDEHFR